MYLCLTKQAIVVVDSRLLDYLFILVVFILASLVMFKFDKK